MPYVSVPNDLSKIKTKVAFNLTKRQLVCFGAAAAVGIPTYLLTRSGIGNSAAMLLMLAVMLPAFLLAMYERDGLPAEKVVRNFIRSRFLWPRVRPYKTDNFYTYLNKATAADALSPSESRGEHGGTGPAREVRRERSEPVTSAEVTRTIEEVHIEQSKKAPVRSKGQG